MKPNNWDVIEKKAVLAGVESVKEPQSWPASPGFSSYGEFDNWISNEAELIAVSNIGGVFFRSVEKSMRALLTEEGEWETQNQQEIESYIEQIIKKFGSDSLDVLKYWEEMSLPRTEKVQEEHRKSLSPKDRKWLDESVNRTMDSIGRTPGGLRKSSPSGGGGVGCLVWFVAPIVLFL
jgi:hypothetical protein